MSDMIPFSFESSSLRFIPNGDSFSVVAKDVAEALEYSWQPAVIKHVPEEWKGIIPINTPGGTQEMLILTEQGLYFFVNRSDKPKALPLQKWVAGEVLPAIRKTGGYSMAQSSVQLDYSHLAKLVAAELTAAAPARFGVQKIDPVDAEFEQVKTYVKNLRFITTSEIVDDLGLRASKSRVGRWLSRLGFFCVLQREYDGPIRVWFRA